MFRTNELNVKFIMDSPGVMKGKGMETKVTHAKINIMILVHGRRGVLVKIMIAILNNNTSKGNSKPRLKATALVRINAEAVANGLFRGTLDSVFNESIVSAKPSRNLMVSVFIFSVFSQAF